MENFNYSSTCIASFPFRIFRSLFRAGNFSSRFVRTFAFFFERIEAETRKMFLHFSCSRSEAEKDEMKKEFLKLVSRL